MRTQLAWSPKMGFLCAVFTEPEGLLNIKETCQYYYVLKVNLLLSVQQNWTNKIRVFVYQEKNMIPGNIELNPSAIYIRSTLAFY